MDIWVLLTLETQPGAWCVSGRSWKQLESPQGLVWRKLWAVCCWSEAVTAQGSDAVTSGMEVRCQWLVGMCCPWYKLSRTGVRKPLGVSFDELSNCSVQALGEGQNWNFISFSLSLFSFSDQFFIFNSKCISFLKKLIALENDFQLER